MSLKKIKEIERQRENRKYKTLIKNHSKEVIEACAKEKDVNKIEEIYKKIQQVLDKASIKKIIHKNKSAREKKKLRKKINNLSKKQVLDKKKE